MNIFKFRKPLCVLLILTTCMSLLLTGCGSVGGTTKPAPNPTLDATDDVTDGTTTGETDTTTTTTTAAASDESVTETPTGLSDDPFSYQVYIDGNIIQLPCNASDLAAIGWVMDAEKADNTLDERYTTSASLYNGDSRIVASIVNNGDSAVKFSEATVDDLYFYDHSLSGHSIAVCKGLTFGSTKNDVIAVYGYNPSNEYSEEGESYSSLTYTGADFYHKIEFAFKDDIVSSISIFTN